MPVRVERRGKSSPACRRLYGPVNPIRSNTEWSGLLGPYSDGWLERCGNAAPRKIVALNDRTRLTDPLVFFTTTKRKDWELEDIYVGGNNTPRNTSAENPEDIYITRQGLRQKQNIAQPLPDDYYDYDYGNDNQPPDDESPKKKPKKRKSKIKRAIKAIFLILVLLAGMGTSLVYYTFSKVNYDKSGHGNNVYLDRNNLMQSDKVKNILLIGVDRRNEDETSRSDTMLLLSINTETKKILLTSFMRDSYVHIPGHKDAKLNAACTWGGAQLVMDTIEYNFNIKIDSYMLIDFAIFENVVDGLDGIEVEVTEKEAKYMRDAVHLSDIEAGTHVELDGKEALWYCRIRKLDSDFMRTKRQRKVMTAIIDKCAKTNPLKMYDIISSVIDEVETDMSPAALTGVAINGLLRYLHYDIEQGSVPQKGTWENAKINGQSVLRIDIGENIDYLKEFIYEQ